MKKKLFFIAVLSLSAMFAIGCSSAALMDASATTDKLTKEEILNKVKGSFVNNGFDVKDENVEAGYITSTYKKWSHTKSGSNGGASKTYTHRLQMRVTLSPMADGKYQMNITPGVKIAEKENEKPDLLGAAVTIAKLALSTPAEEADLGDDGKLKYYEADDREEGGIFSDEGENISKKMLKLYLRTTEEIASSCGLPKEQVKYNIAK